MSHQVFDDRADQYDAWYDTGVGKAILTMEVKCLQPFFSGYPRPFLEVGVGSGRFARALGIEHGVDPALALLNKARARGIEVQRAHGEELPFLSGSFGGVLIALTLCFAGDPLQVLRETSRVLMPDGGLVLGTILQANPWAEFYTARAREGHHIYRRARFFSKDRLERWLHQSGFDDFRYRSVLFQPPGQSVYRPERPISGYDQSAGFVAISAHKK